MEGPRPDTNDARRNLFERLQDRDLEISTGLLGCSQLLNVYLRFSKDGSEVLSFTHRLISSPSADGTENKSKIYSPPRLRKYSPEKAGTPNAWEHEKTFGEIKTIKTIPPEDARNLVPLRAYVHRNLTGDEKNTVRAYFKRDDLPEFTHTETTYVDQIYPLAELQSPAVFRKRSNRNWIFLKSNPVLRSTQKMFRRARFTNSKTAPSSTAQDNSMIVQQDRIEKDFSLQTFQYQKSKSKKSKFSYDWVLKDETDTWSVIDSGFITPTNIDGVEKIRPNPKNTNAVLLTQKWAQDVREMKQKRLKPTPKLSTFILNPKKEASSLHFIENSSRFSNSKYLVLTGSDPNMATTYIDDRDNEVTVPHEQPTWYLQDNKSLPEAKASGGWLRRLIQRIFKFKKAKGYRIPLPPSKTTPHALVAYDQEKAIFQNPVEPNAEKRSGAFMTFDFKSRKIKTIEPSIPYDSGEFSSNQEASLSGEWLIYGAISEKKGAVLKAISTKTHAVKSLTEYYAETDVSRLRAQKPPFTGTEQPKVLFHKKNAIALVPTAPREKTVDIKDQTALPGANPTPAHYLHLISLKNSNLGAGQSSKIPMDENESVIEFGTDKTSSVIAILKKTQPSYPFNPAQGFGLSIDYYDAKTGKLIKSESLNSLTQQIQRDLEADKQIGEGAGVCALTEDPTLPERLEKEIEMAQEEHSESVDSGPSPPSPAQSTPSTGPNSPDKPSKKKSEEELTLYPNPMTTQFQIKWSIDEDLEGPVTVRIYNSLHNAGTQMGSSVLLASTQLIPISAPRNDNDEFRTFQFQEPIDVRTLPAGRYFILIRGKNGKEAVRQVDKN